MSGQYRQLPGFAGCSLLVSMMLCASSIAVSLDRRSNQVEKLLITGLSVLINRKSFTDDRLNCSLVVAVPDIYEEGNIFKQYLISFQSGLFRLITAAHCVSASTGSCSKTNCQDDRCHRMNRHPSDDVQDLMKNCGDFQKRLVYVIRQMVSATEKRELREEDRVFHVLNYEFTPGNGIHAELKGQGKKKPSTWVDTSHVSRVYYKRTVLPDTFPTMTYDREISLHP